MTDDIHRKLFLDTVQAALAGKILYEDIEGGVPPYNDFIPQAHDPLALTMLVTLWMQMDLDARNGREDDIEVVSYFADFENSLDDHDKALLDKVIGVLNR